MKTVTYSFEELSKDDQDKFVDEFVIEDAKEIGKILGIEIDYIYFKGFSTSQWGGRLVGRYIYAKQALKKVKEYAPQNTELHEIALALQELQRRNFYRLSAKVRHGGHYYHAYCTTFDVENENSYSDVENDLADILRNFMQWIYKRLKYQYDKVA